MRQARTITFGEAARWGLGLTLAAACGCAGGGPTLFVTHDFENAPGCRLAAASPAAAAHKSAAVAAAPVSSPASTTATANDSSTASSIVTVAAEMPPVPPAPAPMGEAFGEATGERLLTPAAAAPVNSYVGPSPRDIQCRAAEHATSVALLTSERRLIRGTRDLSNPALALFDRLIGYRTAFRANESAGAALAVYHQLAGGVSALASAEASLAELDAALASRQAADDQGLVAGGYDLDARRSDLVRRRDEIASALAGGQAKLSALVGGPVPLPPVDAPPLVPTPPSLADSVSIGLATRPDLNLLRAVISCLDRKSLPIAVGVLQQFDPAVGVAPPDFLFCNIFAADARVVVRRRQLCVALARQEELLGAEIAANVHTLQGLYEQHASAVEAVTHRRDEIGRLEDRRAVELDVTVADLTTARLALIAAEGDRDRIAHEYQKADATLRASQGLLAVECGYLTTPACLRR